MQTERDGGGGEREGGREKRRGSAGEREAHTYTETERGREGERNMQSKISC